MPGKRIVFSGVGKTREEEIVRQPFPEVVEALVDGLAERADLLAKLHSAKYQPTIVCRGLNEAEADWLKQRMGQRGKAHADVKFSPMI